MGSSEKRDLYARVLQYLVHSGEEAERLTAEHPFPGNSPPGTSPDEWGKYVRDADNAQRDHAVWWVRAYAKTVTKEDNGVTLSNDGRVLTHGDCALDLETGDWCKLLEEDERNLMAHLEEHHNLTPDGFAEVSGVYLRRGDDKSRTSKDAVKSYTTFTKQGGFARIYRAGDYCIKAARREIDQAEKYLGKEIDNYKLLAEKGLAGGRFLDLRGEGPGYMVLKWCERGSLTDALRKTSKLSEKTKLFVEAVKALEVVHEMGLVHKDVKGENFVVDGDGCVYLVDLSFAKAADDPNQTGVLSGPGGVADSTQIGDARGLFDILHKVMGDEENKREWGEVYKKFYLERGSQKLSNLVDKLKDMCVYEALPREDTYNFDGGEEEESEKSEVEMREEESEGAEALQERLLREEPPSPPTPAPEPEPVPKGDALCEPAEHGFLRVKDANTVPVEPFHLSYEICEKIDSYVVPAAEKTMTQAVDAGAHFMHWLDSLAISAD